MTIDNENTEVLEDSNQPPKPVYFTYNGVDYTLDFNRASARAAEDRYNLDVPGMMSGHILCAPDLFKGAFLRHHPNVSPKTAEEIWDSMKEKGALYRRLFALFIYTVASTFEEPDEGNGVSWN